MGGTLFLDEITEMGAELQVKLLRVLEDKTLRRVGGSQEIKVDVKRIVATDTEIADTLLSHAADTGADFMVMGGYGHSRLREFVLGGATRGVLSSMTIPSFKRH